MNNQNKRLPPEMERDERGFSENNPLGGSLEVHDIEMEKEMADENV